MLRGLASVAAGLQFEYLSFFFSAIFFCHPQGARGTCGNLSHAATASRSPAVWIQKSALGARVQTPGLRNAVSATFFLSFRSYQSTIAGSQVICFSRFLISLLNFSLRHLSLYSFLFFRATKKNVSRPSLHTACAEVRAEATILLQRVPKSVLRLRRTLARRHGCCSDHAVDARVDGYRRSRSPLVGEPRR